MNINQRFNKKKKIEKMWNLDNLYIWEPPIVMSKTDAQNKLQPLQEFFEWMPQ